jgi:polysaccharide biosynthesis/export protein
VESPPRLSVCEVFYESEEGQCGLNILPPGACAPMTKMKNTTVPRTLLATCLAVAACLGWSWAQTAPVAETNAVTAAVTPQSMDLLDDQQKLGPGDEVSYRVIEDQDEPRSLTVTDSGDLEIPYLGLAHAAGKTSLQLAKEIKTQLEKKLYYRASVIIALELVNKARVSGKVYVTGQVRNKGGFDLRAGETMTVTKAILNAGGFSDFSDKKHVHLIRKDANGQHTYTINVLNVWNKGKLEEDLAVQPDDFIVVPASLMNY